MMQRNNDSRKQEEYKRQVQTYGELRAAENSLNALALGEQECHHLDLTVFKVHQCRLRESHLPKRCPFYHDARKDKRRPPSQGYAADMCVYALREKECPFGESCQNAHNRVEEFYHPSKYKTKFCTAYPQNIANCEYGDFCCFAHSENDIKIDMLHKMERDTDFYMFHFKTVWCPFNETNHAREDCVYAHNWQDYRRRPHVYQYGKEQCPNWDQSKIINIYFDGCQIGLNCRHSHGWKEQEFHPLAYKSNHCRHGDTCAKLHCPFYHSEKEKRGVVSKLFILKPRNRIFAFPPQGNIQVQQAIMSQNIYMMQTTQAPIFVGSPMEGLHFSPTTSPRMGPSSQIMDMAPVCYSPPLVQPVSSLGITGNVYQQHSFPEQYAFAPGPSNIEHVHEAAGYFEPQPIERAPVVSKPPIQFPSPNKPKISQIQNPLPEVKKEEDYMDSLPVITSDTLQFLRSGSDDESEDDEKVEEDQLHIFLQENGLSHLYEKFTQFGITETNVMTLTELTLEQLGITGEDKEKLLQAIQESQKSNLSSLASIKEMN